MGSYAEAWLGDFFVGSSKNDVEPSLIHLFTRINKRVAILDSSLPKHLWDRWKPDAESGEESESDEETFQVYFYEVPAAELRDRLELMGYTLENCTRAFEAGVAHEIEEVVGRLEEWPDNVKSLLDEELSVLRALSVPSWCEGLRRIRQANLRPNTWSRGEGARDELERHMLSKDWYGCPCLDRNVGLRLALEVVENADTFLYDTTDLVLSGYFDEDDDLVAIESSFSIDQYSASAKTIVLTEGKSDSRIIRCSMELLYPHLVDYFSFFDFESSKSPGGAGNLANLVRAFAGAGIANRTIAVFDNDTAGNAALASLSNLALPRHYALITLPSLELLQSYPTLGPNGMQSADVNGLAVSIEMLLGSDVLTDEKGLVPVQWTGFDHARKSYQGEVMSKRLIQERFDLKLEKARADGSIGADWTGLDKLLRSMFAAFHGLDGDLIFELAQR